MMKQQGFTLIEVLVSMAITGIILGSIYSLFISSQRIYTVQDEFVQIQQTVRPTMDFMGETIRLAGLDPLGRNIFGFRDFSGFGDGRSINATRIAFFTDADHDGALNASSDEQKGFALNVDVNGVALAAGSEDFRLRQFVVETGTWEPIAENIEVLNFVYLDRNNAVIANPAVNFRDIRAVEIALIGRSHRTMPAYVNGETYRNRQDAVILGPQNDNFMRVMVTEFIQCRNVEF